MQYIRQHTDIPVPAVYCDLEDDEAYYLITEYINGVNMADLGKTQKDTVRAKLQRHLDTLKTLVSTRIGRLTGIDEGYLRDSKSSEYVFCHNDLSQHNVLVNPVTLKINAIVDRKYTGFFPSFFEFPLYNRVGPSVALGDEDDASKLVGFLVSQVGATFQESDAQATE
ncbi:uncharacterized protein PG998_013148 [Apiospora kogelbergensis]|uniref:uncharacterized protein n=1 Tax=Apiospora kogelbergensis TaxID=1337665 RepID=UPI00312E8606